MPRVEPATSRVRDRTKRRSNAGTYNGLNPPLHHFLAARQEVSGLPANRSVNLQCTNGDPTGHVVLRIAAADAFTADVISIAELEARVIRVYLDGALLFGSRRPEGLRAAEFNELGLSLVKGRAIPKGAVLLINVRHLPDTGVTAGIAGLRQL